MIVALVTPNGEFGGPTTVAINQAVALQNRGHDVHIVAGQRGYAEPPAEIRGVPAQLFRVSRTVGSQSFSFLRSDDLREYLVQNGQYYDVQHIHMGRDLITLGAALQARRQRAPYFLQTHGMVKKSRHPLSRPLDALVTRKVVNDSRRVFYLTDNEKSDMGCQFPALESDGKLQHLINGVPYIDPHTLAAAGAGDERVKVVYFSRLHPRKRPELMLDLAAQLDDEGVIAEFEVRGPDGGEYARLNARAGQLIARGLNVRVGGPIATDQAITFLSQHDIFVLPSVNEPFPMAVLEAMSAGLAVVVTESCGLAPTLREHGGGLVVGHDFASLKAAVARLIEDAPYRRSLQEQAVRVVAEIFSMDAVARQLEKSYEEVGA